MKNTLLRTLSVSTALAALPAFGAVPFHDLAGSYIDSEFTTGPASSGQGAGEGQTPGPNGSYALVNYTTGNPTGVTLTVSGVTNHSNPGSWKANGDVSTLFPDGSVIDYTHAAYLSGTHTYVFSGLNPGVEYDIAIFADRGYDPAHANASRSATYTLSGASSFTNTSSTGNDGVILVDGATVQLQNGSNHYGNLARWSNIVPDGDTITISITGSGYSGNALRIEAIPEPGTAMLTGLGALGLLLRRRSRRA